MKLNKNHEQDGKQAWKDSGLEEGQIVTYKGKKYYAVAIGYGMLLQGKVQIDNEDELLTVNLTDLEELK
jgi:hypothetical protein